MKKFFISAALIFFVAAFSSFGIKNQNNFCKSSQKILSFPIMKDTVPHPVTKPPYKPDNTIENPGNITDTLPQKMDKVPDEGNIPNNVHSNMDTLSNYPPTKDSTKMN